MAPQHGSLTVERWSAFSLDQRILMIGNERSGYERVLRLTDLTVACRPRRALPRELLRWRDLVAELYVSESPSIVRHRATFRVLLWLTPAAATQIPHVLEVERR